MNPNDMTIDDIRDELARREGYKRDEDGWGDDCWYNQKLGRVQYEHPIPCTREEASKIPPGPFGCTHFNLFIEKVGSSWVAECQYIVDGDLWKYWAEGETEIEARFRLQMKCVLAAERNKS